MSISIYVQQWIYHLETTPKGLHLSRTATPADGGYGATVDEYLPADYFATHSAEQFYAYVAGKAACCLNSTEEQVEREQLKKQLHNTGLIQSV